MLQNIKGRLTRQEQMSEAFILSLFLAFSGGFQDAYTYVVRNHVFANAQTGNVVLMSTYFMAGQWKDGLRYLFPLLAFAMGVFVAENIQFYYKRAKRLHWRQGILLLEVLTMLLVGFLPQGLNMVANILISFSCAMQVQTFRKVCGNAYASTMCIGNLRSGTAALSSYLRHREKADMEKTWYYFGVIFVFAVGAGVGGNLSKVFAEHTIWTACLVLGICFLMMELDREG